MVAKCVSANIGKFLVWFNYCELIYLTIDYRRNRVGDLVKEYRKSGV
ncbi:Undecaprenyl pyrophosphate synthase [Gossypium arboreum]|uniref:Undecaprenyl pyrophosphate synthase n=1 Tax=Gossypium arboreum TaxID=29729 RepID=A0A0B0PBZ1_GOSAR|nr:Undecaprenyl pyrophosphate synthase [Gossypium arboreum]